MGGMRTSIASGSEAAVDLLPLYLSNQEVCHAGQKQRKQAGADHGYSEESFVQAALVFNVDGRMAFFEVDLHGDAPLI